MVRRLQLTAMAIGLLAALGSIAGGSAQAAPLFHCEVAPCMAKGETTSAIAKVNTGSMKCNLITAEGTSAESTLTTVPINTYAYTGCKVFGVAAMVKTEGCTYTVHLTPKGESPYPVTTDIVCEPGKVMSVTPTGINCVITTGSQNGLEGATVTNEGAGTARILNASGKTEKLTYTETGAECSTPGTHSNGVVEGSGLIKGFADVEGKLGKQVGIWIE